MKNKIFIFIILFFSLTGTLGQSASTTFKEAQALAISGKKNKAQNKYEEALNQAEKSKNIELQMACHLELADLKDNVINYKEALKHYKTFSDLYNKQASEKNIALQDSVSDLSSEVNQSNATIEKQASHLDSLTTEQMQSQLNIANLEIEREKNLLEIQAAENRRNTLLFVIGIVVLGSVFIGLGYVRKRKTNSVLRNKNYQIIKEKEKSEGLLLNILPKRIANELMENGRTSSYKHDMATVMFTDFKGFTKFSEQHTPEELVAVIDHYFCGFDNIISKYTIEKIKTIGDAYLCVSGVPEENSNQFSDMIECAKEMRNFVNDTTKTAKLKDVDKLQMRIGIHCGPIVAGVVGTKKFAYDVWGDTVNIAARMEQSGMPNEINVSQAVYEKLKDKYNFEFRGEVQAKNKGMMKMYFLKP